MIQWNKNIKNTLPR